MTNLGWKLNRTNLDSSFFALVTTIAGLLMRPPRSHNRKLRCQDSLMAYIERW
jgi:hypothetical protein